MEPVTSIDPNQACRCSKPHGTGRRYFRHHACLCGGFIVSRHLADFLEKRRMSVWEEEFGKGRDKPKGWKREGEVTGG